MSKTTYRINNNQSTVVPYDDTLLSNRVKALEDKPDNDKQTLTLNEHELSISNGNTVTLPNDKQTLTISGNTVGISDGNTIELPTVTPYNDSDIKQRLSALESKNDKQNLSVNDHSLTISDGNTVNLPNDKQTISKQGNNIVLSDNGGEIELPSQYDDSELRSKISALESKPDNDKQTLSLNGKTLSISNGNSVTLPEDTVDGGDNLICNSGFPTSTAGWGYWEQEQTNNNLTVDKNPEYYNNSENMFVLRNNTSNTVPTSTRRFKVKRNSKYSLDIILAGSSNLKGYTLYFLGRKLGERNSYTKVVTISDTSSSLNITKLHYVFNVGECDEGFIRIDNKGTNNSSESKLFFTEVDVYEGTSPRAYSPSVKCAIESLSKKEDNDKQTLTLNNNVLSISNGNSVTLPSQGVSLQDFNDLKNEYTNLKNSVVNLLQNLKDSGAWNQTGSTIFEGALNPGRDIATGNINLFSKTVDGNLFIRTNSGKSEGDLAGGIN